MFFTAGVIAALLLSLLILFYAISVHRRQQLLNRKRAEYMAVKKENAAHWKRFESSQIEIDRQKADIKARTRDLNVMILDMDHKRKEIREVLDILKEESDRMDSRVDQDISKIVERRKQILRTHWKETNGLKTLFIQKMQEVGQLRAGIDNTLSRKDSEYIKWTQTKLQMARLKHEFETISRSSILNYSSRND